MPDRSTREFRPSSKKMQILQCFILLPSHSLEDFPTHHRGSDADSLLSNWTVPWHPQLIAQTKQLPNCQRADEIGDPEEGCLYFAPTVSKPLLPAGFLKSVERVHSRLFNEYCSRDELLDAVFADGFAELSEIAIEQAADFLALGYAFLQVQLMTRQLRGSSNLDEAKFEKAIVEAAVAWAEDNFALAKQKLRFCFDRLLEEKNAYYPVQPEMIDLVLVAPTTIGTSLANELVSEHPKSFLLPASLGKKIESDQPENFGRLRQLIGDDRIGIASGLDLELDEPLLSSETSVSQTRRGLEWYRDHLNADVSVFARRTFGLAADLPKILDQFNFIGVLHTTMGRGELPTASTSHIRWESRDGASVLALAQVAEDANEGFTFLRLSIWLGQVSDSAHTATVLFAHWPNRTHFCFQDLLRIRNYGNLFGAFLTLDDFFDGIYDPGYGDTFSADEYRGNYFKSFIASGKSDPVSSVVKYWQRLNEIRAFRVAATLDLIANEDSKVSEGFFERLSALQARAEEATVSPDENLDDEIKASKQNLWRGELCGDTEDLSAPDGDDFALNVTSFARIIHFQTKNKNVFAKSDDGVVRYCDSSNDVTDWIVRVPPMSYNPLQVSDAKITDLKNEPLLGEDNLLRNEFFELMVDRDTGGIRSLDVYSRRKNLLSQRLSARLPGLQARYAEMVCDDLEVISNGRVSASVQTRGRIVDRGGTVESVLANFQQTVTVRRGKPIAEVEISFDSVSELSAKSNHYLCSRLAWKHDTTELTRNVRESRTFVTGDHIEATNWIEIQGPDQKITLLTGGLPFHRRSSRRTLDTVLVAAGESERRFRFAIGLGLEYPASAAVDFLTPKLQGKGGQAGQGGWLFDFNCKNVIVTWMTPIFDQKQKIAGVQIRLRETQDRSGQLKIRCPRQLSSGRRVNFFGDHLRSIDTEENVATVNFHGCEYFQIQLNWNS